MEVIVSEDRIGPFVGAVNCRGVLNSPDKINRVVTPDMKAEILKALEDVL